MKKATNYSLLFYVVLLAAIYFIGSRVIGLTGLNFDEPMVFLIIALVLGFVFNVVLLELGHILGAKMGGYKTYSVSLLGLVIYKKEGKWKIGYDSNYDGFTGETKVVPYKEKTNPMSMFWGGSILLIIEIAVFVLLPTIVDSQVIKSGGYIFAVVAGAILIYNIAPIRLDSTNDAALMKYVKGENVEIYNMICQIQYDLYEGKPLNNIKVVEDINYISGKLNYYASLEKIYKGELEDAEKIIDKLIENSEKLSDDIFSELLSTKLYILTLTKEREEVEKYYTSLSAQDRKYINASNSIQGCRNYLLFISLIIEDIQEARDSYNKYKTAKAKLKEIGRLNGEEKLLEEVKNKIALAHPEWDLEKED